MLQIRLGTFFVVVLPHAALLKGSIISRYVGAKGWTYQNKGFAMGKNVAI